jgi:hypothetical protein
MYVVVLTQAGFDWEGTAQPIHERVTEEQDALEKAREIAAQSSTDSKERGLTRR